MSQLLKATAFASTSYLGFYGVWYMFHGTPSLADLNGGAGAVFFPYLPHGAKVIAAWLIGWRSVPALLPATLLHGAYLSQFFGLTAGQVMAFALVSATVAYLAFETFRLTHLDLYPGNGIDIHWRRLLLVGVVASVYNGVGIILIGDFALGLENQVALLLNLIVADLAGLVVVLLGLWAVLKRI